MSTAFSGMLILKQKKAGLRCSKATLPVPAGERPAVQHPVKTECVPHAEKTDAATEFFTKRDHFNTSRATLASS
jgi:hypothetical protein